MAQHTNALVYETSPYLRQHAHNPVDWYPWCEEALDRARDEEKPILLSIGYSACHWCHVMAHECFEDTDVAELMNSLFINIKVDREERPDLDKIYQLAHQMLTQRGGGWPLTMFLTADRQIPFFGGTYFPKTPRHGLPGFPEVLKRVAEFYRQHRDEIEMQNEQVLAAFDSLEPPAAPPEQPLDAAPLDLARNQLASAFDPVNGGFGGAPKFPHPTHIERLLRHWAGTVSDGQSDDSALTMACTTLTQMGDGGVYDQLGGGFYRYAVDEQWMIPHFEKMLYDNGPLLALYAQAWAATGDGLYRRVVAETGEWALREMQSPEGGFYASLDADSAGEEGGFYTWTKAEVERLLNEEEYPLFARRFGLDRDANFQDKHHLCVYHGLKDLSAAFDLPRETILARVDQARAKLFAAREERTRPGRDEKILTSWNGLMIQGLAVSGRLLERGDFIDAATRAVDFIRQHLWQDGRLLAAYKEGQARFAAYLDDYVFLANGLLELLQARWRVQDMAFLTELVETLLAHYEDKDKGGFYFTADDHEDLIHRPKPSADESTPAGNGIAALVLGRLGHVLSEPRYLTAAEHTLRGCWPAISEVPYAHDALLTALEEQLYPPQLVILRGPAERLEPWHRRAHQAYAPRRLTLAIPGAATDLPGALSAYAAHDPVNAYVCAGTACSAPITDLDSLAQALTPMEAKAS